jgi:hypothetical protein
MLGDVEHEDAGCMRTRPGAHRSRRLRGEGIRPPGRRRRKHFEWFDDRRFDGILDDHGYDRQHELEQHERHARLDKLGYQRFQLDHWRHDRVRTAALHLGERRLRAGEL